MDLDDGILIISGMIYFFVGLMMMVCQDPEATGDFSKVNLAKCFLWPLWFVMRLMSDFIKLIQEW